MIRITFLGTAAARPTVARGVSALAFQREGDLWLLDCGEGTQRQMMRYGTGFGLRGILITHLHGDHVLGLTGLLRTLALQDRTEELPIYGPPGSASTLEQIVHLGGRLSAFPVPIRELEPGMAVPEPGADVRGVRGGGNAANRDAEAPGEYSIEAFEVSHGVPAVGYILREHPRPGRFDVDRARALGIPEGPLFGRLHRGEVVEVDGARVHPDQVVGPPRPGRSVVFTGDTRPCRSTVEAAAGAELLVHDATFGSDEAERARQTFHSTAREAARIGRDAGVKRLALTHLSARYSGFPAPLEREAREVMEASRVAHDGLVVELAYPQDEDTGEGQSATSGAPATAGVTAPDAPPSASA